MKSATPIRRWRVTSCTVHLMNVYVYTARPVYTSRTPSFKMSLNKKIITCLRLCKLTRVRFYFLEYLSAVSWKTNRCIITHCPERTQLDIIQATSRQITKQSDISMGPLEWVQVKGLNIIRSLAWVGSKRLRRVLRCLTARKLGREQNKTDEGEGRGGEGNFASFPLLSSASVSSPRGNACNAGYSLPPKRFPQRGEGEEGALGWSILRTFQNDSLLKNVWPVLYAYDY